MSEHPIEDALKPECDSIRADLLAIEKRCRALVLAAEEAWSEACGPEDPPAAGSIDEMHDSGILAVRHIEDARMRVGKVLQYSRDGVSIYDKAATT